MKLNYCVACGEEDAAKLEHHHLVPRFAGGSNDPTNLITLCFTCHAKAHGYERQNTKALTVIGIAKAKAKGKKLGNPEMVNRDPEAIRKIAEIRNAIYLNQLKATADTWLPIVERMRPSHRWDEVVSAIEAETGQEWSIARLCRAVKRLVSKGLADPRLLHRALPSPHFVSQVEPVNAVIDVLRRQPNITVRALADLLYEMGVPKKSRKSRVESALVVEIC